MPPEANDERLSEPRLWQGLEEFMDSPEFRESMENEFPDDAAEWTDPVSRRNFIGLMGASLALAGAAGCSPRPAPMRKIVPYTNQPEQMTPGVPLFFASACPLGGYVDGVVVRSNEGRPTKIEGNPDHPSSLGGTGVITQASILDLYDPDRSKTSTRSGSPLVYEEVIAAVRKELDRIRKSGDKGKKLRLLTGTVTSPTLATQINGLLAEFPEARWAQHEPCGQDAVAAGTKKAFGRELNVVYDFAKADVIVSLDSDFLGTGPGHVRYSKDFATRRRIRETIPLGQENQYVKAKPDEKKNERGMSRLYVVEGMPSVTGSVADHRLAVPASQVDAFARALAAKLGVPGVSATGSLPGDGAKWLDPLANDLNTHKGKCIVVAGDCQPPQVHVLAYAMNVRLGNIGATVQITESVEVKPPGKVIDLPTLVKEMAGKAVETLLILGGTNPAYTAPSDVDFAAAIKNVPFRFHLGSHQDETAALCEWHVNEAHYLEAWGDGRGHDGTIGLQQPLIAPLYAGKSALELLVDLNPTAPIREGRELVRATWRTWFAGTKQTGEFEVFWQEAVRSGVVKGTAMPATQWQFFAASLELGVPSAAPSGDEYEINFRPDSALYDGRYANNGWLQELPRPITRVTWDNAAYVSLATFKRLQGEKFPRWMSGERGRMEVSVLELDYKGRKIKLPIWPLPGHPDNAVTVHLGFGRERAGRVGNQDNALTTKTVLGVTPDVLNVDGKAVRGTNAYVLRTSDAPWIGPGVRMKTTGDNYYLACLQAHWSMVQKDPLNGTIIKRDPVRHFSLAEYVKNPWQAKIPPVVGAETDLISHNIPGPAGKSEKESGAQNGLGTSYGPGHDHHHGDDHKHEEHGHDTRIFPLTMYNPNDALYPGLKPEQTRRWGMAFDLSACTGCSACMIACQSENNTPVVGKREVTRGHDMFWIRIDRYYAGTQEDPVGNAIFHQPVPCQQCEKAPCEIVCPVGATAHTSDGLNDMAYNRCVGTRYCSNNCPYKVRRFNFLTFQDWTTESLKLGRNPDVSVRSRGVMEKCTYCVQRIRFAEIVAERESRAIRDGEIRTACQAACPSGAISFGDLNDKAGVTGQWKGEPSNYGLLAELNTMPRTSYLASIRNPNPELK